MSGGIKVTIIDIQTPPAAGGRNGVGLSGWTATGGACCFCGAGDARSPRNSFFHTLKHIGLCPQLRSTTIDGRNPAPLWDV